MRNLFIKASKNLLSETNLLETYQNLSDFWGKENFQIGYCACLEKIWHLNKDSSVLINLADIISRELNDERTACLLRAMMFYEYSPDVFIKFLKSIKLDESFIKEIQYESSTTPWILLSGRYLIHSYLMIFATKKKELGLVMDLSKNLMKLDSEIQNYLAQKDLVYDNENNDYLRSKNSLSEVLAEIEHHNDINRLAISLNPNNEKAYLNIIEDYVTYKNYDEAKNFYNNQYATKFNKIPFDSIIDICWFLSSYYSKKYEFYKTLVYQKLALEIELQEKKV